MFLSDIFFICSSHRAHGFSLKVNAEFKCNAFCLSMVDPLLHAQLVPARGSQNRTHNVVMVSLFYEPESCVIDMAGSQYAPPRGVGALDEILAKESVQRELNNRAGCGNGG